MDRKKRAAAMAAVYSYIKTGEEIQARQMADPAQIRADQTPVPGESQGSAPNIWGMTGRQFLMQASTMMQLRMFK
ncbi:MAG: hypothetical protein K9K21_07495 [Desulfotignum sp.]|nr:hypothetical protein [Desulfotignum sp.]MCF8113676.1 hypothetical protein [Desulfotignum sp.]MCF8126376.1 hypothetical protein [Desulfotignum sp.]